MSCCRTESNSWDKDKDSKSGGSEESLEEEEEEEERQDRVGQRNKRSLVEELKRLPARSPPSIASSSAMSVVAPIISVNQGGTDEICLL
jgi:hypothetical protein